MISPRYIAMLRVRTRAGLGAALPTAGSSPSGRIGRVVVEIEGVMEPEVFIRLPHALGELWDTLRQLPIGWTQYDAFRYFFGPGAVERVTEFLDRDGRLELSFSLAGRVHAVRVQAWPYRSRPYSVSRHGDGR